MDTYTSYQLVTKDLSKSLERVEDQPTVKRDSEYFLANISKAKTIDDFLGNDRLFRYAMKAHGLEDMTYAKAFMKKVLKEGIEDRDSFANKLTDKRYYEFAKAFDFHGYGETATIFTRAQQGTVDKYVRQTLEQDAGKQNEGVRLALYFERKAGDIDNFYDILADTALSKVARTILGLPDSTAAIDIDKQVKLLDDRLDIADFKDPAKLKKLMTRFTSMWDLNNGSSNNSSSALNQTSVLFSQSAAYGFSTNLMLSLSKLRA